MSGIAAKLAKERETARGLGSNAKAVKYLNQDFQALRNECLEAGRLFQDPAFPAAAASLGFNELGPNSYKTKGIAWKRPTVGDETPSVGGENHASFFSGRVTTTGLSAASRADGGRGRADWKKLNPKTKHSGPFFCCVVHITVTVEAAFCVVRSPRVWSQNEFCFVGCDLWEGIKF